MKIRIIAIGILLLFFLGGCVVYGKGQTTGYIYAVDDGPLWDEVWYKSDLASSESDCYLLKNNTLKEQLRALPAGTRVKLNYDRHVFTLSFCPEGTGTDDQITSYELIETLPKEVIIK